MRMAQRNYYNSRQIAHYGEVGWEIGKKWRLNVRLTSKRCFLIEEPVKANENQICTGCGCRGVAGSAARPDKNRQKEEREKSL